MKPATSKTKRIMLRVVPLYLGTLLGLYLLIATAAYLMRARQPWEGFKAPDDTKVARELLAQQFTGPRYFHFVEAGHMTPSPYIAALEARRQIGGIIEARHLPPEAVVTLEKLIERLAVPASSRVAGVDRVNTLQLNLALDEMK